MVEVEAIGDQGLDEPAELRDALLGGRGGTGGISWEDWNTLPLVMEGRLTLALIVPVFSSAVGLIRVELFHTRVGFVGVSTDAREGEIPVAPGLGLGEASEAEWPCFERSGVAILLQIIEGRKRDVGAGSEDGAAFSFVGGGVGRPTETAETRCASLRKGDIERDSDIVDDEPPFAACRRVPGGS
jgi:hypothetical protein